jgi:hypothetical protein
MLISLMTEFRSSFISEVEFEQESVLLYLQVYALRLRGLILFT